LTAHKSRYSSVSKESEREGDTNEFQEQILKNNKSEEVLVKMDKPYDTSKKQISKAGTLTLATK
jgi:hypothetical protein